MPLFVAGALFPGQRMPKLVRYARTGVDRVFIASPEAAYPKMMEFRRTASHQPFSSPNAYGVSLSFATRVTISCDMVLIGTLVQSWRCYSASPWLVCSDLLGQDNGQAGNGGERWPEWRRWQRI